MRLYSPLAEGATPRRALAPRPRSLDGKVLGILDNGKWNAGKLLGALADGLGREHGVADLVVRKKNTFSRPADEELLVELGEACDAVVTAIGD